MFRRATGAATGPWCRRRAARGLLALLLGVLVILPASAGTTFGARTQIWPFLFGGAPGALSADQQLKQAVTAANLAHYGAVGAGRVHAPLRPGTAAEYATLLRPARGAVQAGRLMSPVPWLLRRDAVLAGLARRWSP